jgi:hypothetical protein
MYEGFEIDKFVVMVNKFDVLKIFSLVFLWPTGVNCNAITIYLILLFVSMI